MSKRDIQRAISKAQKRLKAKGNYRACCRVGKGMNQVCVRCEKA